MRRSRASAESALALALLLGACASAPRGEFVWIEQYAPLPAPRPDRAAAFRAGDLVDVRVLGQEQLSAKVRVRTDGGITLPFLGDLMVAGKTPAALDEEIHDRLRELVNSPVVTVSREEGSPEPISMLGEITRAGGYPFEPGMRLVDALARAGGLTDFAHKDRVFVLRGGPPPVRIRFDARRLLRGEGPGTTFLLEPGDVIVAE